VRVAHVGVEIVAARNGAYVGGLVKNVATLARAQAHRGDDIEIFTTDVRGILGGGEPDGMPRTRTVRTVGEYGSLGFASSFMVRVARAFRRAHARQPFDVVHVHSAYSTFGGIGYLLPRSGVRTVFSLYSPNFRAIPGHSCDGRRSLGAGALLRTSLRPFDGTTVPSLHLQTRLEAMGLPSRKTSLLPPAIDSMALEGLPSKGTARAALGIDEGRPVVAFVGNYSPWKGVEDLLVAMREVRRQHPDALLLTAWGEPYEWSGNRRDAVLGLIDSLGLESAVHQVGIVPDIRVVLRSADVLASPFHCTCKVLDVPLSILEAFACGIPVVSTEVGGIPETLGRDGERGLLVGPRRPAALAATIASMLDEPKRRSQTGIRATDWVRDRFRSDVVAAHAADVYAGLRERERSPIAVVAPAD